MFCPQCGKEIPSEAIFCPYCRAEIHNNAVGSEQEKAFNSAEPEQIIEGQSLKSALRTNRKRPKRLLTQVLIVALALALATSVAYAAYYVYTNVWLPSQQTQEQQQPAAEEPTYTVNTVIEEVSVPDDPYNSPGQRSNDTWEYDQIVSSVQSDAIDNINRRIQENMINEAEATSSSPNTVESLNNGEFDDPVTLSKNIKISYMDNNIVCFLDSGYQTVWGVHGWSFRQSQTYDLKTGEPIDPWTVFGMTKEEAIQATEKAVRTYLASNPSDIYTTSEAIENIESRINNDEGWNSSSSDQTFSPLVITNEGLVYLTAHYELGSYAFGIRDIVVARFDGDNSKVGTDIG